MQAGERKRLKGARAPLRQDVAALLAVPQSSVVTALGAALRAQDVAAPLRVKFESTREYSRPHPRLPEIRSPHLLVKFVGTERGEPFTSLSAPGLECLATPPPRHFRDTSETLPQAPGLKSSYLTRREVAAWVAPPEGWGGAAAGPRAANSDEYKLRERR